MMISPKISPVEIIFFWATYKMAITSVQALLKWERPPKRPRTLTNRKNPENIKFSTNLNYNFFIFSLFLILKERLCSFRFVKVRGLFGSRSHFKRVWNPARLMYEIYSSSGASFYFSFAVRVLLVAGNHRLNVYAFFRVKYI